MFLLTVVMIIITILFLVLISYSLHTTMLLSWVISIPLTSIGLHSLLVLLSLILLCELVFKFNLQQLVTSATHLRGSILDLVITNSPDLITSMQVDSNICSNFSDHYLISFSILCTRLCTPIRETKIFHYSRADLEGLFLFFANQMYSNTMDINSLWLDLRESIKQLVICLFHHHIPQFTLILPGSRHKYVTI